MHVAVHTGLRRPSEPSGAAAPGHRARKPQASARGSNPERVRRWREEECPVIHEEAARVGSVIYFADEAGIRSDYHSGTNWAPVGKTRS